MKRWEALSAVDFITIITVAISSNDFSSHVCSYTLYSHVTSFLKQGVQLKATSTWFFEIALVHMSVFVCMCVCLSVCVSTPRALITSDVICCDISRVRLVKQV